ncbi:MAG TPA: DNA polymerase IV [Iamia sp.]|nr:DNA polymerase IV [Iamia sp.]
MVDRTDQDWVLHLDLDQFLAAVEIRRRPELAGRPVVVGGDGDPTRPRQVVATASYEARAHGVRSGLPLRTALRRCPDAVFLPSDRAAYDAASEEVMATLRSFPVVVEVWGWDEAFVGVRTDDPEGLAADMRAAVLARTGLSCAIGIGESRLLAKTAVRAAKPGGIARLTRREWAEGWGPRPVTEVWGIGSRIARRLEACGVRTIDDLARADADGLAAEFGPRIGPGLKILGLGGGTDPLDGSPRVAKGRSKEVTFTEDITDPARVAAEVDTLARAVTAEVVADGRLVTHVAVKVRTATFWTRTKISKLADPTTDPAIVAAQAAVVLGRFAIERPIRLLGVRVVLDER